jgi:hypothetical protein
MQYLRSRYYSSRFGRFITKDTWQSDFLQSMSYTKWIYGNDNPVINVDPTGHIQCKSEDRDKCLRDEKPPRPNSMAGRIQEYYSLLLEDHSGWWYQNRNPVTPYLSIEEFLGISVLDELNGIPSVWSLFLKMHVNQIWVDHTSWGGWPAYCHGEECEFGVFNFLANYSQSAQQRARDWINDKGDDDPSNDELISERWRITPPAYGSDFREFFNGLNLMQAAYATGEIILHPFSPWVKLDKSIPFGWGNDAKYIGLFADVEMGPGACQILYKSGNFIVYNELQREKWLSK